MINALTDTTGSGAVTLFGLPQTAFTQGTGALVTDYFIQEAQGRVPAAAPDSVAEIRARLGMIAAAATHKVGGTAAANEVRSVFARETLSALDAAPSGASERTFALLQLAARSTLAECMDMEFRASARLLGLAPLAAGESPVSATLFTAPLGKDLGAASHLRAPRADLLQNVVAARFAAQSKWENALEPYFTSGEAGGVVGDLFRRRYSYFKAPTVDMPYDETALKGLFEEENQLRATLNMPDLVSSAREELEMDDDVSSSRSGGGGSFYTRNDRASEEEDEENVTYEAARIVATEGVGLLKSHLTLTEKAADIALEARKVNEKEGGGLHHHGANKPLRGVPLWLQ